MKKGGLALAAMMAVLLGFSLMAPVVYAQTTSAANISTVADTSSDTARRFSLDASQVAAGATLYGNAQAGSAGTDPAGGTYTQLVPNSQNQFGYKVLPQQVSAQNDFTVTGFFNPDRLTTNGSTNSGDWIGLVLLPVDAQNVMNGSAGGGGALGMSGIKNAIAMGIDMYQNPNYNDPSAGPFGAVRWTGSAGTPQPVGPNNSFNNLYTSSQNLTQWSTTIRYSLSYVYNNGRPYLTGTLQDTASHLWTFTTLNPGGGGTLTISPPEQGYYTVAMDAANGLNYQSMRGSFTGLTGTRASSGATIQYQVDPNMVAAGGTVAPSTTLRSTVGDVVGISGISAGAIAGTDTYAFDGGVPSTAAAQYRSGWHISRTVSTNDGKPDITYMADSEKNVFTLYYAPDFQEASLRTDSTDPTGAKSVETIHGASGGAMSWTKTDSDLARSGYVYSVTAPNGQSYASFTLARQAVPSYDNTTNGTARTDASPQTLTVSYRIDPAIVTAANQAITSADASNVKNESAVQDAVQALQTALANPAATPQQIQSLTTALNNAVSTAQSARQSAVNNANSAVTSSNNTSVKNDTPVQTARNALNSLLSNPDVTTQQIQNATNNLNNAVTTATADRQQARQDAAAAQLATSPVTHETDVRNALNALNTVLANTEANTDQIKYITSALNSAIANEKTKRNAANQSADAAVADAQNGSGANDPAIQNAINNLRQIQQRAAADSASDLTQNIAGAITALNNAVTAERAKQQPARDAAAAAIAGTSPVSGEIAVAAAKSTLQDLLNDPKSTAQQITDATTILNSTAQSAKSARDSANSAANATIAKAEGSPADMANEAVQQALSNLRTVMANAAADTPGAPLTADIIEATKALNDALSTSSNEHTAAVASATDLLTKTAPVSHETDVASAIADLNSKVADPNAATQDIATAMNNLQSALDSARGARNSANTAAYDSLDAVRLGTNPGYPVRNEPSVQEAAQKLESMLAKAASDSPEALTKDITPLTATMNQAVTDALTARTTATQNATNAVNADGTKPVSNEPATADLIRQVRTALESPGSMTTEQLDKLVTSLNDTIASDKAARNQAVADANSMADAVSTSPVSNEPSVREAVRRLREVMATAASDSPGALTKDIQEAAEQMKEARNAAQTERNAAVDSAKSALDDASNPAVAEDAGVRQAKESLDNLLSMSSPTATTQQIKEATDTLNHAVRDAAMAKANQALADANASGVANEQGVAEAKTTLQNLMGSMGSTAWQITDAANELQAAVAHERIERSLAANAANKALESARGSTVAGEPGVTAAQSSLEALMGSPTATTQEISAAAQALDKAVRDATVEKARQAIANAQSSNVAAEPGVAREIADLQKLAEDPNASAQDIAIQTDELNRALTEAQAGRNDARNAAAQAIARSKESPAANEAEVAAARDNLQKLLDDPQASAQQVKDATAALEAAMAHATDDRRAAMGAARRAVDYSNASAAAEDAEVSAARSNLQNLLSTPGATTQDIIHATDLLNNAVRNAVIKLARETLEMANEEPFADEPGVQAAAQALAQLLSGQNASTERIEELTRLLQAEIDKVLNAPDDPPPDSKPNSRPNSQPTPPPPAQLAPPPAVVRQTSPPTGDNSNPMLWLGLLLASAAGLAAVIAAHVRRHRRAKDDS